ncbi:Serine/arginine repetitive matrix protein 2 [Didymella heteroderae]|uniref:Serine/arginine repetitive matrix protein 2 n=1 Tax=Didymella heteroderae TaxID=1769908 RepID=A0A9P5BY95_9PLEO|nr:Serine/arginine repetitive matrix protein 2 [Didymella heteroderae]
MRAYSPELKEHNISEEEFIAFIDNLAIAQAPPAPFQILDVAGHAVGFVPHHWAMFAGAGMNFAAGVGTAAVSYGRTRYFLEKVNREYFTPRGLQVSICKYQQLIEKLAVCPDFPVLVDKDPQAGIVSVRDRCMSALQPYLANLSLDVPPPKGESSVLEKIAAKGIERRRRKQDKKYRKKSGDSGHSSDSSSSSSRSSSSDSSSEEDKAQRKVARRLRKTNRKAKKDLKKRPSRAAEIEEDQVRKVRDIEYKPVRFAGDTKRTTKMGKRDLEKH